MMCFSRKYGSLLAGAVLGVVGLAGTSMISAAPASADVPVIQVWAYQGPSTGFPNNGQGSRNVEIDIQGAHPNLPATPNYGVWYGVQDLTTHVWYGGWTGTDYVGNATRFILNIPVGSCGHSFRVDATDWANDTYTTDASESQFVDNCGPMLGVNYNNNTIYGNGFTAGAKVIITAATGKKTVTATTMGFSNQIGPGWVFTNLLGYSCENGHASYATHPKVVVATLTTECLQ